MEKTFNYSLEMVFKKCKKMLEELEMTIDYISKSEGLIQATAKGSYSLE